MLDRTTHTRRDCGEEHCLIVAGKSLSLSHCTTRQTRQRTSLTLLNATLFVRVFSWRTLLSWSVVVVLVVPFTERSGQAGGAMACRSSLTAVHRQMAPRLPQYWSLQSRRGAYHQPSRELRHWVVDVLQPWLSTRTLRPWLEENRRKGANREMLAMCSYPFCEDSATVFARQASRFPRV